MTRDLKQNTFPKTQRLLTPAQFQRVYANKQWGNTRLLTFNVLYDAELKEQPSKLGITVSKKVSKLAVRRNLLKRLIREFYRHKQHELTRARLIITVKPAASAVSNEDLLQELTELWTKLMKWQRWNQHQLKEK